MNLQVSYEYFENKMTFKLILFNSLDFKKYDNI